MKEESEKILFIITVKLLMRKNIHNRKKNRNIINFYDIQKYPMNSIWFFYYLICIQVLNRCPNSLAFNMFIRVEKTEKNIKKINIFKVVINFYHLKRIK